MAPGRAWLAALVASAGAAAAQPPGLLALRTRAGPGPPAPLAEVVGRGPALVAVLATYCPPCRAEVPALNRAARAGLGVVGLFIDVDDARALVHVTDEWRIEFPVRRLAGEDRAAARALVPRGLPASFLVDGDTIERHDRLIEERDVDAFLTRGRARE